jgi:diguanylate cyclase (GGDEF)-like protein
MNLFPIGIDGDISAAIAVLDPLETEKIKKHIARICQSVSPQLEILRLRNEVSDRDALANAVRTFSDSLKSIDADDFWQNITRNVAQMLGAERASLLIADEKSDELEIKAMIGAKTNFPRRSDIGNRVARVVLAKNEPALITDVEATTLPPVATDRKYRTGSFLSYPISIGERAIGVISFTDRAGGEAFDEESLELFQAIAPQLAVAIDRANLKEKAGEFEQLSVTDALTGLLNRRYIEERLLEEIKRSNRHGFPMSFMMVDVDHFKSYNDEFGHPEGDKALKLVARVIRETLRGADVAARFGGEEFAILLPQTTGPEAVAIAERIRINLENSDLGLRKVTASIGVASCSADLCASDILIEAADKALYAAKREGRNRVLAFEEMTGTTVA